jgi:hypothetical protein
LPPGRRGDRSALATLSADIGLIGYQMAVLVAV